MPFTFSHPAIILPLLNKRRKIFSATGLIVGSIAPDFESFIRVSGRKIYSHTWGGMFWFDLPLSIVICFVFHLIVREPLIENLPHSMKERLYQYKNFNWLSYFRNHIALVIISILTGITSHLLWDALTHLNLLDPDSTASQIEWGHIRLYIILQYSCSYAGLFVIILAIIKMPKKSIIEERKQVKYQYWLLIFLFTILTGSYLSTVILNETDMDVFYSFVLMFIYITISSFLFSLVVVSLFYKLILKKATLYN